MSVIYVVALSSQNFKWAENIKTLIEKSEIKYANYWMHKYQPLKGSTGQKVLIRWDRYIVGEATLLEIEKNKLCVNEVYKKYGCENGILPGTTLNGFINMLNTAFSSKTPVNRDTELGCMILQDVKILEEKDWYLKPTSNQHGHYIDISQVK